MKKILFISSRQFDYLQDLSFSGLVNFAGRKQVVDYPWNPKYHLPIKNYPKNLGYTGFSLPGLFRFSLDEIDTVVLGSAKRDALETYQELLPKIRNKLLVFIDGGDREEIGGDFYRLGLGDQFQAIVKQRPFDIIFKREYLESMHADQAGVYPFPFSFPHQIKIATRREEEKKYQVAFWGQQKPAVREKALRLLQDKYDCAANGTGLNQDFKTYKRKGLFYLEELAACRIVLNFRGGGWDTMRYWEAVAAGAFMISQRPAIEIPNNFVDGKHIIFCDDNLDDLIDKIDYYLPRVEERGKMAAAAKDWLEKYHLNTRRAEYFLDCIHKHTDSSYAKAR
jgi:hypothetical protein